MTAFRYRANELPGSGTLSYDCTYPVRMVKSQNVMESAFSVKYAAFLNGNGHTGVSGRILPYST